MDISVFLGAPGSGKGTQAKRLVNEQGYLHYSTGDMLRSAITQGTPVGIQAKTFIDRGELVPDGVMIELIKVVLKPLNQDSRVILDGFPRTVPQAEALEKDSLTSVSRAFYFSMPDELLIKRLSGRRTCSQCGEAFHVEFIPPKVANVCDKCGGVLTQRSDDKEEVVHRRLTVFHSLNSALVSYYRKTNRLLQINANAPVKEVSQALDHAVVNHDSH